MRVRFLGAQSDTFTPSPMRTLIVAAFLFVTAPALGQSIVDQIADALEPKVIEWRRDFHANPELSNREFRTAGIVAKHLRALGMEVTTEVAHTGVIGILRGAHPGPVVALRADMDALPVLERVDIPFKSEVTSIYRGNEVPVMHACGHDTHVAMLMGAAEALAGMRENLHGTVKFIFQPAEEGPPAGEEGGAEMLGTIRTFDPEMRETLHRRFREIVNHTAASNGATADIALPYSVPVTYNDPDLTEQMLPTLRRTAGADHVRLIDADTGAEDFSFFAQEAPGLFVFIGGKPLSVPEDVGVSHHTPDFFIDESGMKLGVRTLLNLTLDYMEAGSIQ